MLIFVLDDEPSILEDERQVVANAAPDAEIRTFMRGKPALEAVVREGLRPDFVFSDIEMPGMQGLTFATELKKLSPESRIVFVTGYKEYAVDAFRIKANGYLLKPLTESAVREEMEYYPSERISSNDKLEIKCFGHFDVYWKGKPLIFNRRKSKELLAYLVDRKGAACSSGEVGLVLWDDWSDNKTEQNRLRVLISDLRTTLRSIGMENVLIREHRQLAIRKELVECDYFRLLDGDMDALNSYRGEYMKDYSWAEFTNSMIVADPKSKKKGKSKNS